MSYDEHMKKIMSKPKLLPIRVSIAIECKAGLKIENVHVKPYDNVNDLFKIIEEYQAMRGDPVLGWSKDRARILLTGPLYGDHPAAMGGDVEMEEGEKESASMS